MASLNATKGRRLPKRKIKGSKENKATEGETKAACEMKTGAEDVRYPEHLNVEMMKQAFYSHTLHRNHEMDNKMLYFPFKFYHHISTRPFLKTVVCEALQIPCNDLAEGLYNSTQPNSYHPTNYLSSQSESKKKFIGMVTQKHYPYGARYNATDDWLLYLKHLHVETDLMYRLFNKFSEARKELLQLNQPTNHFHKGNAFFDSLPSFVDGKSWTILPLPRQKASECLSCTTEGSTGGWSTNSRESSKFTADPSSTSLESLSRDILSPRLNRKSEGSRFKHGSEKTLSKYIPPIDMTDDFNLDTPRELQEVDDLQEKQWIGQLGIDALEKMNYKQINLISGPVCYMCNWR